MSQENVEIVRRLYEGLEQGRDMSWLELCDEQIEIRNIASMPVGDEFHGHDGVRQWATEVWEVFSEFHNELEEMIDAGDGETIVCVQRTQARMRHTKMEMDARWATVWTVRDGKALSAHGYMTKTEALEAAGLLGGR